MSLAAGIVRLRRLLRVRRQALALLRRRFQMIFEAGPGVGGQSVRVRWPLRWPHHIEYGVCREVHTSP